MAEAATTTRPSRARKSTSAPAKAVEPKATSVKIESTEAPATTDDARTTLEFEHERTTKTYEVFKPPAGAGVVGSVYAPLGTHTVKVLLIASE